jgi:hypothetical protein
MISKTFEWYRIISPTPKLDAVEARTKAATELTVSLSKQDPRTLLALAQGIARQFDGSPAEVGTIEWLLRTLKQHDPAVSESLSDNELELRCIAAITLGELLFQSKGNPEKRAAVAAASFISAMNMRSLPRERYLRAMIEELSGLALVVLETAADARRKRIDVKKLQDEELAASDIATAQKVISQLHSQIADLDWNAVIDREEISLFRFMAAGFSRTKKKAFSDLPVSVAAVHAALDLERFLLIPAPLNSLEVFTIIVESKRKAKSLKPIPLSEHVTKWSSEEWDAIAGAGSFEADLASKFPVVLPIIWIANRMREGQSPPNWTEFNNITHLRGEADLRASQLGRQLLNEKVVVALMGELNE